MAQAPALGGPSLGLHEANHVIRLTNGYGSAIEAGDVLEIDRTTVDSGTLAYTKAIAVAGGSTLEYGLYCVALEDVANSATAEGMFLVRGVTKALMQGATSAGDALAADTGEALDVAVTPEKVIAYALEATVGATKASVYFNGIEGFGAKES
jgi:hypothetical protein